MELLSMDVDVDISAEAHAWTVSLREYKDHLVKFDCDAPFHMPVRFDILSGDIDTSSFVNLLDGFRQVEREQALEWQEFNNYHSSDEDMVSQEWAAEILMLSLDVEMKSDVLDVYDDVPFQQRGAITLYFITTELLVNNRQEAITGMIDWYRRFSILNYDGQDVRVATRRVIAMAKALGNDLPANVLTMVLDGFAQASCEKFQQSVRTTAALLENSLLVPVPSRISKPNLKRQLITICNNLRAQYVSLCIRQEWTGASHVTKAKGYVAAGAVSSPDDAEDLSVFATFEAAQCYAAVRGRRLSYQEWIKTVNCHFCGEKGHIKPECSK